MEVGNVILALTFLLFSPLIVIGIWLIFAIRRQRDYGVRPSINSEVHCDRSLK